MYDSAAKVYNHVGTCAFARFAAARAVISSFCASAAYFYVAAWHTRRRTMATEMTMRYGMAAPAAQVYDLDGTPLELASFWMRQPTLIFFLRHAGCALCRVHLHDLRDPPSAEPQRACAGLRDAEAIREAGAH